MCLKAVTNQHPWFLVGLVFSLKIKHTVKRIITEGVSKGTMIKRLIRRYHVIWFQTERCCFYPITARIIITNSSLAFRWLTNLNQQLWNTALKYSLGIPRGPKSIYQPFLPSHVTKQSAFLPISRGRWIPFIVNSPLSPLFLARDLLSLPP